MPKKALATKRATLAEAIDWIAHEDENNDHTSALDMASSLTVCLAADLFGANQYRFAGRVIQRRRELGFDVREMTPDEVRDFNEGCAHSPFRNAY